MPAARVGHPVAMSIRKPLPPTIARAPFAVRAALAEGVTPGRLAAHDLARPFRGARDPVEHRSVDDESRDARERRILLERCTALAPLLKPGQHFSHTTAARLWGCPFRDRFTEREALHVSSPAPARAIELGGTIGHQKTRPRLSAIGGLPVSDPCSTWLAVASMLKHDELVALGDHLILEPRRVDPLNPRPHTTLEELDMRIRAHHGRGRRAAASALLDLRQGAESRPETLLRLLLMRAGFSEPRLQAEIRDAHGRWLGFADLYWPQARVIVEYDGEHHRTDDGAYDRDMTRIEDFIAAGNTVVRVRKSALFRHPDDVVRRVRRAFEP